MTRKMTNEEIAFLRMYPNQEFWEADTERLAEEAKAAAPKKDLADLLEKLADQKRRRP